MRQEATSGHPRRVAETAMTRGQAPGHGSSGGEGVEWRPGGRTQLHAAASKGATQLCVMEQWCEPGTGAPTHTHFGVEEAITVLEGVADFRVDGEPRRVEAGETILLPASSRHGFVNGGSGILHTFAVFGAAA